VSSARTLKFVVHSFGLVFVCPASAKERIRSCTRRMQSSTQSGQMRTFQLHTINFRDDPCLFLYSNTTSILLTSLARANLHWSFPMTINLMSSLPGLVIISNHPQFLRAGLHPELVDTQEDRSIYGKIHVRAFRQKSIVDLYGTPPIAEAGGCSGGCLCRAGAEQPESVTSFACS
jgi:hypothetical protein